MVHIAWLGKKSPFCGNVTYGNSTTENLKARGHKISFIHFDNPSSSNSSKPLFLANDPDVSLPYLIKSQVYTIPSPRADKELKLSLERLKPDIVHASLTLSPLDFRLPELCNQITVPLIGTLISLQSSGSLKSNGDKVRLACTMSGFNLSNDSLSSFSALGEGIV